MFTSYNMTNIFLFHCYFIRLKARKISRQSMRNPENIGHIVRTKDFFFFFLSGQHRTTGEGGEYLFNSSVPLPPASQNLNISRAITAASSPLHIASSRTRNWILWFPSASRQPLSYVPLSHKDLQYDWSRKVQYWPYCSLSLNILQQRSTTLKLGRVKKIEIY